MPDTVPAHAGAAVIFAVADERLALPARTVAEVIRPRALTLIPHAPPGLLGVVGLRGTALPVVSLAAAASRAVAPPTPASRIIVIAGATPLGLLVDAVVGIGEGTDVPACDLAALTILTRATGTRRTDAQRPQPPAATAGPAATTTLLTADVAGQAFALPLAEVAEVVARPRDMAAVPFSDEAIPLTAMHRGETLPIASLRTLLGLPPCADGRHVAVVHIGGHRVGLLLDAITGIVTVPLASIEPAPPILTRARGEARIAGLCHHDGRLLTVLAPSLLLDAATVTRLQQTSRAGIPPPAIPDAGAEPFVLFRSGAAHFGLPLDAVEAVVRKPETVTRMPRMPPFVTGAINLRGASLPLVDQNLCSGLAASAPSGRHVIVVSDGTVRAGLVVDAVTRTLRIASSALRPAPAPPDADPPMFDRLAMLDDGDGTVLLLDPRAMLRHALREVAGAGTQPRVAVP